MQSSMIPTAASQSGPIQIHLPVDAKYTTDIHLLAQAEVDAFKQRIAPPLSMCGSYIDTRLAGGPGYHAASGGVDEVGFQVSPGLPIIPQYRHSRAKTHNTTRDHFYLLRSAASASASANALVVSLSNRAVSGHVCAVVKLAVPTAAGAQVHSIVSDDMAVVVPEQRSIFMTLSLHGSVVKDGASVIVDWFPVEKKPIFNQQLDKESPYSFATDKQCMYSATFTFVSVP